MESPDPSSTYYALLESHKRPAAASMDYPTTYATPLLASTATPSSRVTRPPMDYPTTYWPDLDLTAPPLLQPGWDG